MRSLWLSIFLLPLSTYAHSDNLEKLSSQGAMYFQAKEAKKAIKAYEKAKEIAKPGIQKEILSYNLATSYLEDNQFSLAVQEYEHLLNSKDHVPDYLYKKSSYNLLISYLNEEEALAKKEEFQKEHLERGNLVLKKANELFRQISLLDYEKEEIDSLWLKLKEVSFLFQKRAEQFEQSQINLEKGMKKLLVHLQDQVQHHEQLGQKKLGSSMTQYFLNKRYVLEKKFLPYWGVVENLLKKEEQEKLSDTEEKLLEAKALLNQFQDAQNEHLASLDCIKENLLWQGRLRAAKAEVGLKLIDIFLKKEDAIDFCLQKRIDVSQKQKKNVHFTSFFASLNHELKMMHGLTASIIEAQQKAIENSKEQKDVSFMLALLNALNDKVKHGGEIEYDPHLYRQLKSEPTQIVYPLYAKLEKELKPDEASFIQHELRATVERFELQSKLQELEKPALLELISKAYDHFLKKENNLCYDDLENFLIAYAADKFVLNKILDFKGQYEHFLSAPSSEELTNGVLEKIEKMQSLEGKINPYLETAQLSHLSMGLKNIEKAVQTSLLSKTVRSLLMDEGYQWIYRLRNAFSDPEKEVSKLLHSAIVEQKHALKFSEAYPALEDVESDVDQIIYDISLLSQSFPVEKAKECADILKKEKGSEKRLHTFQKGLKAAQKANELLKKEAIAWGEVSEEQKKAIQFWLEAFENNSDSNPNQSSSTQDNHSQGSSSDQNQNTANLDNQSSGAEKETNKDLDKIMGILEKLQEMQQDDKIINKKNQTPKKGLRPW